MHHPSQSAVAEALDSVSREYATMAEVISDMNRLGSQYGINEELLSTPRARMLVCKAYSNKCTARIIGMYDQHCEAFLMKRCELKHSCGPDQQEALLYEISRKHNLDLRCGKLLEDLLVKDFLTGYKEVHKMRVWLEESQSHSLQAFQKWLSEGQPTHAAFENDSNRKITDSNKSVTDSNKSVTDSNKNSSQINPENKLLCRTTHETFRNEFCSLNPHCYAESSEDFFFFRQPKFTACLRLPAELKIYERQTGHAIFVLQYDPSNEPLIQTVMVTELPKRASIDAFARSYRNALRHVLEKGESSPVERRYSNFFIIEPDVELMDALEANSIEFFLKTRSICAYLEESRDDDPLSFQYFHECNYGSKEFLKIDKKRYLRKFCDYPLFNINNMPISDLEFMTPPLLALPFFEYLNSVIWHISVTIATKKKGISREAMCLPEIISEMIEEMECNEEIPIPVPNVSAALCWCGKFQEFLIPCCHATRWLKQNGSDPYYYVSSVYLMSNILDICDIVPVVCVKPDCWVALYKRSRKLQSTAKKA